MRYPKPEPHFAPRDATTYSFLCPDCVHEKNAPRSGRAWSAGEAYEDVTASGDMPTDIDEQWVTCHHGHEHLVIREGSERAANFGHGSNE